MNGLPMTAEQRAARKRQLQEELMVVRQQKADVLRQIQQIAKKQRTGPPPPRIGGLSPEARRQEVEVEHHRRKDAIWQGCLKIMQELLKNSTVKSYFGEPVRTDYAPMYYDVIKRPMDLGTIKQKLEKRKYADVYGFLADVRLTFSNCRDFNPPGNHVRTLGDETSDKFERKWVQNQVEAKWESERQRYQLELERIEAESKSLPDKLKEVNAELAELTRKAEARAQPLPPGPGRDMSFEEKRQLSVALSSLPYEKLSLVMELCEKDPSVAGRQDDDEEFELDIDALGNETLWKLHAIVKEEEQRQAAARPPPKKAPGGPPAAAGAGGAAAGGHGGPAAAAPAAAADGAQRTAHSGSSSDGIAGGADAVSDAMLEEGPSAAPGCSSQPTGSDSEEVGSKGNAGSTFGDHGETKKPHLPPGGHDLTTFVSATGPGMHPQILKNTGHKKDVQLTNANAWASLTAGPAAPPAAAAASPAPQQQQQPEAEKEEEEEEDNLWSEFQGREQQQRQQEEQKKALEEEERKKKEAEAEALRKQAEEAKAAKQRAEQERQQAIEKQREREREQLQDLQKVAAEESKQPDILGAVGHDSNANLAALGLVAKDDEDELMDEEDI
ncbi:hypothetical protein N2152v2_000066 [Parachlorella kessleri]